MSIQMPTVISPAKLTPIEVETLATAIAAAVRASDGGDLAQRFAAREAVTALRELAAGLSPLDRLRLAEALDAHGVCVDGIEPDIEG